MQVTADGSRIPVDTAYDQKKQAVIVTVPETELTKKIQVSVAKEYVSAQNQVLSRCFDFLNQAEISFVCKDRIYRMLQAHDRVPVMLAQLHAMELDAGLYGALAEILTARQG